VAGAQHIGGADVAGADVAHVTEPGGARQQIAEGERAEQVADGHGSQRIRIEEDVHGRAPSPLAEITSAQAAGYW
jgi:hypothetical protein